MADLTPSNASDRSTSTSTNTVPRRSIGREGAEGLSEEVIGFISAKKSEPQWMLDWRLEAYRRWLQMDEPTWARVHYPRSISTTFTTIRPPRASADPTSLVEVDPELLQTYERLGIPLKEQEILSGVRRRDDKSSLDGEDGVYSAGNVAVDAIFDSVSVVTTFKHELAKAGV